MRFKSFEEVKKYMFNEKTKRQRYIYTVGNNTKMRVYESTDEKITAFALTLHQTDILFYRENCVVYNTGGWRSATTMNRMQEWGPLHVFRKQHIWYAQGKNLPEPVPYFDGIVATYSGEIMYPPTERQKEDILFYEKQMLQEINEYTEYLAEYYEEGGRILAREPYEDFSSVHTSRANYLYNVQTKTPSPKFFTALLTENSPFPELLYGLSTITGCYGGPGEKPSREMVQTFKRQVRRALIKNIMERGD